MTLTDSSHKKLENSDDAEKPPVLHWTDITTSSVDLSNPNQFPITKLARMLCQRYKHSIVVFEKQLNQIRFRHFLGFCFLTKPNNCCPTLRYLVKFTFF